MPPVQLAVRRTRLAELLPALRARLVQAAGLPASLVKFAGRRQGLPRLDGDQDVVLQVKGFRGDARDRDRHHRRVFRRIDVHCRSRCETDESGSDEQWLTDPQLGATLLEEAVLDALHNFVPTDAKGNNLVFAALEVADGYDYERRAPTAGGRGWGSVTLVLLCPVLLPFSGLPREP